MDATDKRAFAIIATAIVGTLTLLAAGYAFLGSVVVASTGGSMDSLLTYAILAVGGGICAVLITIAHRAR
ncbi:MAG TPA: hypothetical protein VIF62_02065 [Labilithrix sp.]|jgi:hypothetical protein